MSHCQPSKASLLAVREFRTQGKNAANKTMDGYVQNLLHVMEPEAHQSDRSGVTFNSLRKNLAWWAVTQRTSKTTKLPKLGDGACLEVGACLGQYGTSIVLLPPGSTDTTTSAYSIQMVFQCKVNYMYI